MTAKEELLRLINDSKILCVDILIEAEQMDFRSPFDFSKNTITELKVDKYGDSKVNIRLFPGYTIEDLESFLSAMEFEYDSGYGGQNLYGIIWMQDGTWLTRGEYDGSEWWDWHRLPKLPIEFQRALNIEKVINKANL